MRRTPRDSAESSRRMTRRGLLLGGAQIAFAGVLGLRMRHMQVDQAAEFRLMAEENRINIHLIPPSRGRIFDREGRLIAENEQTYRITMRREDAGDVEDVIGRLSALVDLRPEDVTRALEEMRTSPPFLQVTVADRVSWEAISRVAVNAPALPGVYPEVGLSRFYPQHETFAHVVGYVGPVSERDLARYEDPEPVLRIPRFQIGKVGVEAKFEEQLRGSAGAKRVEVNAVGRVMRELDRREGEAGADLQLTVDSELQDYIKAQRSRAWFIEKMRVAMADVDVLVTPTIPIQTPTIEGCTPAPGENVARDGGELGNFTGVFNTTGSPSLSVTCGFTRDGMPIGMMITGTPHRDDVVLGVGDAYERRAGWRARRPAAFA